MAAFAAGDRVEANFENEGEWYAGTVRAARADGTYHVVYDDGDEEERVPEALVRLSALPEEEPEPAEEPATADAWADESDDGAWAMESADALPDPGVEESKGDAPPAPFAVGDRVLARYEGGGEWYPGEVAGVSDSLLFEVLYDDGEIELGVPAAHMRREARPPPPLPDPGVEESKAEPPLPAAVSLDALDERAEGQRGIARTYL